MSSVQQGSNDQPTSRRVKAERGCRRSWTPQEEAVLIASLKKLVAIGWRSDNGFKMGYLPRLEEALQKEFPGTDLKQTPHITSKLQTWKKNYYSLNLMFAQTGVGFNSAHVIDCTQEQWDSIVKQDGNAKTMRYKSWPLYEDWKEIFGKDRANGDAVEDVVDMSNNMMGEDELGENKDKGDDAYWPNVEHIWVDDVGEHNSCRSQKEDGKRKRDGKGKRKKTEDVVSVVRDVADLLGEINRSTNARLDTLASRIGYEFDMDEDKKKAFSLLADIPNLEEDDKFYVCDVFAEKPERLVVFKGLPDASRGPYVRRILESKPK